MSERASLVHDQSGTEYSNGYVDTGTSDLVHTRPARSFTDLIRAYRLIYQQYLKRGYCSPSVHELYFNRHSLLPTSVTFTAANKSQTLGTLTLIHDSEHLLPSDSVFSDELTQLRIEGLSLAEVSMFAVSDDSRMVAGFDVQLALMAETLAWCLDHRVDLAVVTINPRHEGFYKLCFDAQIIGQERSCDHVRSNPGILIALDIAGIRSGKRNVPKCLAVPLAQVTRKERIFGLSALNIEDLLRVAPRDWSSREMEPRA